RDRSRAAHWDRTRDRSRAAHGDRVRDWNRAAHGDRTRDRNRAVSEDWVRRLGRTRHRSRVARENRARDWNGAARKDRARRPGRARTWKGVTHENKARYRNRAACKDRTWRPGWARHPDRAPHQNPARRHDPVQQPSRVRHPSRVRYPSQVRRSGSMQRPAEARCSGRLRRQGRVGKQRRARGRRGVRGTGVAWRSSSWRWPSRLPSRCARSPTRYGNGSVPRSTESWGWRWKPSTSGSRISGPARTTASGRPGRGRPERSAVRSPARARRTPRRGGAVAKGTADGAGRTGGEGRRPPRRRSAGCWGGRSGAGVVFLRPGPIRSGAWRRRPPWRVVRRRRPAPPSARPWGGCAGPPRYAMDGGGTSDGPARPPGFGRHSCDALLGCRFPRRNPCSCEGHRLRNRLSPVTDVRRCMKTETPGN
ncbi:hypothetical protein HMPREF1486_03952, partial [Streptomyces sp. HPH0547]